MTTPDKLSMNEHAKQKPPFKALANLCSRMANIGGPKSCPFKNGKGNHTTMYTMRTSTNALTNGFHHLGST